MIIYICIVIVYAHPAKTKPFLRSFFHGVGKTCGFISSFRSLSSLGSLSGSLLSFFILLGVKLQEVLGINSTS